MAPVCKDPPVLWHGEMKAHDHESYSHKSLCNKPLKVPLCPLEKGTLNYHFVIRFPEKKNKRWSRRPFH